MHSDSNVAHLIRLTWLTTLRFILAAGAVEFTIGPNLICGILPRLIIVGIFVPFNLTLPFLPATKLLGNLPVFVVMNLLYFLPARHVLRMDAVESGATRHREIGAVLEAALQVIQLVHVDNHASTVSGNIAMWREELPSPEQGEITKALRTYAASQPFVVDVAHV